MIPSGEAVAICKDFCNHFRTYITPAVVAKSDCARYVIRNFLQLIAA